MSQEPPFVIARTEPYTVLGEMGLPGDADLAASAPRLLASLIDQNLALRTAGQALADALSDAVYGGLRNPSSATTALTTWEQHTKEEQ